MPSRSLRKQNLPRNVVILYNASGALPCGFSHECSLFGKYIVQVPDACTNPGCSVGAATHTHGTGGTSHTHTTSSTAHTHTASTGTDGSVGRDSSPLVNSGSTPGHTHAVTISSTTPNATVCAVTHDHGSVNNCLKYSTVRYVKLSSTSISLRKKNTPKCTGLIWTNPIADIPSEYTRFSGLDCRFPKAVACACAAICSTGGSNCHTHSCVASHAHTTSLDSHTHTVTGISGDAGSTASLQCGALAAAAKSHSHAVGTPSVGSTNPSASSTSSGAHNHSGTLLPKWVQVAFIKKTSNGLRKNGLPSNSLAIWIQTLATIPENYLLADGTNCTTNLLDRYPRGIPNACTGPGTTGGAHTHNHVSCATHTHTACLPHTHTITGSTAGASGFVCSRSCASSVASCGHGHSYATSNSTTVSLTLAAAGAHTHDTVNHQPASKQVAIIQKA